MPSHSSENRDLAQSQYQLLAPITQPDKVVCVGMNYRDTCEELGAPIPLEPLIFSKFSSCIIGPFDGIPYPDLSAVFISAHSCRNPIKDHVFITRRNLIGKSNWRSSSGKRGKTSRPLPPKNTFSDTQWLTTSRLAIGSWGRTEANGFSAKPWMDSALLGRASWRPTRSPILTIWPFPVASMASSSKTVAPLTSSITFTTASLGFPSIPTVYNHLRHVVHIF